MERWLRKTPIFCLTLPECISSQPTKCYKQRYDAFGGFRRSHWLGQPNHCHLRSEHAYIVLKWHHDSNLAIQEQWFVHESKLQDIADERPLAGLQTARIFNFSRPWWLRQMHWLCKVSWQAFLGIWRRQSFPMGHACRKTNAKVLQLWRNRKHRWSWQSRSQRIPQFLRWLSISLYRAKRQVLMPNCLGIKQVRRSGFRCLHRRLSSHDWYQKPQRWSAFIQKWWPLRHD